MHKLSLLLTLILSTLSVFAQHSTIAQEVPLDTAIRTGVLENGMTYYVRRATKQKGLAEFRLVQLTGSLVEEEHERGIAHFLEHMMFKGSKHFPGNGIIDFLRRHGVAFGPDINAFTTPEHTLYQLSGVPITEKSCVDSCLLILHDWSTDVLIQAEALESERNVIVEEWRGRTRLSVMNQMSTDVMVGTRYAERIVIGDMDVIRTCTSRQLKDFYRRWYQPQHQCIIIVGDFDPDEMVNKVKSRFSDIPRGNSVIPDFGLPIKNKDLRVLIYRDKQAQSVNVTLMDFMPFTATPEETKTVGWFKQKKAQEKALSVISSRLDKIKDKHESLIDYSTLCIPFQQSRVADAAVVDMAFMPDNFMEGLESTLTELERLKQHGPNEEECALYLHETEGMPRVDEDTTVIDFEHFDSQEDDPDDLFLGGVVENCIEHFERGTRGISPKSRNQLESYFETHITAKHVQEGIRHLLDGEYSVMTIVMRDDDRYPSPTPEEIKALVQRISETSLENKFERAHITDSLEIKAIEERAEKYNNPVVTRKPGKIRKKHKLKDINYTEYLLSNGVRVWAYNRTDTMRHNINIRAFMPGGKTLLEDNELIYNTFLKDATYDIIVTKDDNNHNNDYNETNFTFDIAGSTSELEYIFNKTHACLTSTEIDKDKFQSRLTELRQQAMIPKNEMAQHLQVISSFDLADSNRIISVTPEIVDGITVEKLQQILNRLQSNYNGMTVVIDCGLPHDSLIPHIKRCLASLPSLKKPVQIVDRSSHHLKDHDDEYIATIESAQPIAQVFYILEQEKGFTYNATNVIECDALASVMGQVLLDHIRMKNSDVYSITVPASVKQLPVASAGFPIIFTCNPKKYETIVNDIQQLIDQMAHGDLITQALVDNYISHEAKNKNDGLTNSPANKNDNRDDIGEIINNLKQQGIKIDRKDMSLINALTPEMLRQRLCNMLENGYKYKIVLKTKD